MAIETTRDESGKFLGVIKGFRWVILGILLYGGFSVSLDQAKTSTLVPYWSAELAMSPVQMGMVMASTYLGQLPMIFLAGIIADWFGARRAVTIGIVGAAAISAWMAFVGSYEEMYYRNIAFGVCLGLVSPAVSRMLALWFAHRDQGGAVAIYYSGMNIAGVLGTPIALWAATTFGWRIAFIFIAAIAVPCILMLLFLAADRPEKSRFTSAAETAMIVAGRAKKEESPSFRELAKVTFQPSVLFVLISVGLALGPIGLVTWVYVATMSTLQIDAATIGWVIPLMMLIVSAYGFAHGWVLKNVFKSQLRLVMSVGAGVAALGYLAAAFVPGMPWWLWVFCIMTLGISTVSTIKSSSLAYWFGLVGPKYVGSLVGFELAFQVAGQWWLTNNSGTLINPTAVGLAQYSTLFAISAGMCAVAVILPWLCKTVHVAGTGKGVAPSAT